MFSILLWLFYSTRPICIFGPNPNIQIWQFFQLHYFLLTVKYMMLHGKNRGIKKIIYIFQYIKKLDLEKLRSKTCSDLLIFCFKLFFYQPSSRIYSCVKTTGTVMWALQLTQLCRSRVRFWSGLWARIGLKSYIVSDTCHNQHPTIWIVASHFWLWAINIVIQSGDSNPGLRVSAY